MKSHYIYNMIESSNKMPVISEDVCQILELLNDPSAVDIDVLSSKVEKCNELNILLLENINSGYFRNVKKIATIKEAIILIGMRTIINLIVFFITKSVFKLDLNREQRKFDIHKYWRHVLGTSIAAQIITQRCNKGDKHMLFTYGLIHDIGIPVLDYCLPEYLDRIAEKVNSGTHQIVAEKIVLGGLTHSEIGAWLCQKWHFRCDITEIVQYHHTPFLTEVKSIDNIIMHVADVISTENYEKLFGINSNYEVSSKVLEKIGLSKEDYDEIALRLPQEIDKVGTYFLL